MCPARPSQWPSAQAGRENPESLFFRQDLLPRGDNGSILLYQVAQGCTASGELWGLLGDFRTVGHPNTLLGDKVSLLASNSGLGGGFAPSQPAMHSGDWGGWGLASVRRLKGQMPPPPCRIQTANPGRGRRREDRAAHTGVVRRFSMLMCTPSFRSCWKKSCTCRKPASWSGL